MLKEDEANSDEWKPSVVEFAMAEVRLAPTWQGLHAKAFLACQ